MNGNSMMELPWDIPLLREIVEESTFTNQCAQISSDAMRLDEAMDAVKWALTRRPETFPLADEASDLHIAKTDTWGDMPRLRVFFKFDDVRVRLLWVEPIPPEEDEHEIGAEL